MNETSKKVLKWVGIYAALSLIAFIAYYIVLPPIHLQSTAFWGFLTFLILLYTLPLSGLRVNAEVLKKGEFKLRGAKRSKKARCMLLAVLPIAVIAIGGIISSTFFFARSYAAVIDVKEAVFSEDMPETENVTNIALMDSDTAAIVGNRTLGSLSDVVSQFEIAPSYTQINYRRTPKKVANLEYADVFKWLGNRKTGIPGYVMVDPVNNTAEYKKLGAPIRYAESGFFGDDLMRALRFKYPTKIMDAARFEIDDEGKPFYVVPCYTPKVALFGAKDVSEVILFDPTNGESTIYAVSETPSWIDIVYDGYLATEKYNWKGTLSGGFFNSIIGNKDCKQTTDDFGYIVIGDDVWYFTGVTSVNGDLSNIGFIISNARTGEYKFYSVNGAEEHSAMSAAEGEVQEKNYVASFPALINVRGEATYIMVLKDQGGLVKLYAMVNVEQYHLVATGETQEEAKAAYLARLTEQGVLKPEEPVSPPADETVTRTVNIERITPVVTGGETYLYLTGKVDVSNEKIILRAKVTDDERILFLAAGETVSFTLTETDTTAVYDVVSFVLPE